MRRLLRRLLPLALAALAVGAFASACGGDDDEGSPSPTPANAATATVAATTTASPAKRIEERLRGVPGIVDATNLSWPREVEGLNGRRTIEAKPMKIHTMSAGIDEITLSLVSLDRVVGVGSATKNPDTSSFAPLVKALPTVAREPEAVVASGAELVIATPTQKADVVAANPGIIIIPMPKEAGEKFKAELLAEPTLAGVPAVRNGKVYVVPPSLYTTNSFANVRAVEHLAHILWPNEFPVADPPQFSLVGQGR